MAEIADNPSASEVRIFQKFLLFFSIDFIHPRIKGLASFVQFETAKSM